MAQFNLYPPTSPYYSTTIFNSKFLDVMVNRPIPMDPSDVYYTLLPVYEFRPDLFAYDMYNDSRLWWVFAQRNPNRLKDPIFDFTTGTSIYVPKLATLKAVLGI
jgi:hypothetical protein